MKFDKSKLPSRHTTVGPDRAPHRSFYYAMDIKKISQDLYTLKEAATRVSNV